MKYTLKVDEGSKRDVGRQIARIPSNVADKLSLRTGDVIEIKGKRTTYAKIWRSSPPEIKPDTIKIEAIIRKNLNVNIHDTVEISSCKVSVAKNITVQPIKNNSFTKNLIPYLAGYLKGRVVVKDDLVSMNTGISGSLLFSIVDTDPKGPVLYGESTELKISTSEIKVDQKEEKSIVKYNYENIGGLSDALNKIREMIELPLRYPQIFEHLGIQPPKGVLLYGPPGTGKTLLARAIANETSSSFFEISGPEITSRYYGESEGKLRDIFEEAKNSSPSIIFIDEIDSIVPKREESGGDVERRIVAQLLSLMDGINNRGDVVVIGATNRPNSIDEALRRGGRFDREIEIGIPDKKSRLEILHIHTRGMPLNEDVDIEMLANRTYGFVGADLETLTKEAALYSLRRFLPNITLNSDFSKFDINTLSILNVSMSDFEQALTDVSPSALREVIIEKPNIRWNDIGGLTQIKDILKEVIEWPMKHEKLYNHLHLKPASGVLLYGPPGTGKTMLAKAVANEAEANFISIKGPELLSKWIGESEKGVREIFRKARAATPCIIFFDEMDSIASSRDEKSSEVIKRIVSQLLTEIDGLVEMTGVTVLAATNRPDLIDPALLRPGRFDKVIFVGNPDQSSRKAILDVYLKEIDVNIDSQLIAENTEGYSGAELSALISNAKSMAIREFIADNEENYVDIAKLKLKSSHVEKIMQEMKDKISKPYNYKPTGISELNDIGIA